MVNWQAVAAVYFGFSVTLMFIAICAKRKLKKTDPTVFEVVVVLLLGPIIVSVYCILDVIHPPSGNFVDIVYNKLSYTQGKISDVILEEIRVAGESLGWPEESRVISVLDFMTSMGYARCEMVSIRSIIKQSSEFDQAVSRIPDEVLYKKVKGSINWLVKNIESLPEDDLPFIPVYFKGILPKRRGSRNKFSVFGRQWLPA